MLQLENLTPFAADMALFANEEGVDTLYVMVKASFNIAKQWTLIDKQHKPVEADIYWGEPENSSLKHASDYHIGKPASDIIMNGLACAPDRKAVSRMDIGLKVGAVQKNIVVFGDRQWRNGQITIPQPFQSMPVIYERSFGGMHIIEGDIDSSDQRNPLGLGYVGSRSVMEMNGQFLPNLEDPLNLISSMSSKPVPACFGFVSPAWQPRVAFTGTYDQDWMNGRAPYLPVDFDRRFLNMAHSDLIYPGYLQGGESVNIRGMHPGGDLQFNLPEIVLISNIYLNGQIYNAGFNLETLILEPNELQLSMVWRAAFMCDKKSLKISKVQIKQHHVIKKRPEMPKVNADFV